MSRAMALDVPADAGQRLRSARLQLRRFTPDDLPLLVELNADVEVMRHLGGVMSEAQSADLLRTRIMDYYDANPGLGVWATVLRDSGECVGMHMLNNIHGESLIQLGYRLFRRHWGRGYATEMSVALLRYGYTGLGLESICAITAVDNRDSQKVLLKAGLRRSGERAFSHPVYSPYGAMPYFERRAREWLSEFDQTQT